MDKTPDVVLLSGCELLVGGTSGFAWGTSLDGSDSGAAPLAAQLSKPTTIVAEPKSIASRRFTYLFEDFFIEVGER